MSTLTTATLTDPGIVRKVNQDSVRVIVPGSRQQEKGTMIIVADGLGGYAAGDVAGGIVVAELPRLYYESDDQDRARSLRNATIETNEILRAESSRPGPRMGMASTVVAAVILDRTLIVMNVGDSRAYVLRHGRLHKITQDHCVPVGKDPAKPVRALTQSIGAKKHVTPYVNTMLIQEKDLILLCSDGLTDMLADEEIRVIVSRHETPAELATALVDSANRNGGQDNITVAVSSVVKTEKTIDEVAKKPSLTM